MPSAPLDLANPDANWHGLRPGMTREEARTALQQREVEMEEYANDGATAFGDDWEMELQFTADGSDRLREIALEAGEVFWNGKNIADQRLDVALRNMDSPANAVWEADCEDDDFPSASSEAAGPSPTDDELLADGTVWIPERALGFALEDGEIAEIKWRDPRHLPMRYAGPVTAAQRELSNRKDLSAYIQAERSKRAQADIPKDPLAIPRRLITIAAIAGIAWTIKLGFEDDRQWKWAPSIPAKLVSVEKLPTRQFRDFVLPPLRWIFPSHKTAIVDHYRMEFTIPGEEAPRQAVLERGEFYVNPDFPGQEPQVVYLAGNPPRVKGPSRARDVGFIEYAPTVIAIGGLWLILTYGLGLIPAAFRIGRRYVQQRIPTSRDPDRPELR